MLAYIDTGSIDTSNTVSTTEFDRIQMPSDVLRSSDGKYRARRSEKCGSQLHILNGSAVVRHNPIYRKANSKQVRIEGLYQHPCPSFGLQDSIPLEVLCLP